MNLFFLGSIGVTVAFPDVNGRCECCLSESFQNIFFCFGQLRLIEPDENANLPSDTLTKAMDENDLQVHLMLYIKS